MNKDLIDQAFEKMINERGIFKKLGVSSGVVRTYRYSLKNDIPISTDTKLKLLQKTGWTQDDRVYNRADLVALLNFYKNTSMAARDEGPEYVIGKWEFFRDSKK
jgi:hypothetical protein